MIKVSNMTSPRGREVPNQFIIEGYNNAGNKARYFQSYSSIIVEIEYNNEGKSVYLDEHYWNYSTTTGKYRNLFLGEDKRETEKKIKSGEYQLTDLNKSE